MILKQTDSVMKAKCYISVFVGIMILIPIVLNIIIGAPNPFSNIEVVGSPTEWLSFYGSYLGGLLAVLVGLFTIFCESRRNGLNIMIQDQNTYLEKLRFELADIISSFDYWYLGSISLDVANKSDKEAYEIICHTQREYLNKLNDLYRSVTQKGNAFGMIYSECQETYIKKFRTSYIACYKAYGDDITEITRLIKGINSPDDIPDFWHKIETFNKLTKGQHENLNARLLQDAQYWINMEEDLLNKMKMEQTKLCPKISF